MFLSATSDTCTVYVEINVPSIFLPKKQQTPCKKKILDVAPGHLFLADSICDSFHVKTIYDKSENPLHSITEKTVSGEKKDEMWVKIWIRKLPVIT